MCAEEFHDGFLSYSGGRRIRVRASRATPAVVTTAADSAGGHAGAPARAGEDHATAGTTTTTHERRSWLRVKRRRPGRRLDHDPSAPEPRDRGPFDWMAVLRGLVLLGILASALWFEWVVAKAVVALMSRLI
jgi:hypothetical protein